MAASKSFELDFGGVIVRVTITEDLDGTLTFTAAVTEGIADIRGIFFDLTDESLASGLSATGPDVTDEQYAADSVLDLGNGANMNGSDAQGNPTPAFDGGVEIGTQGIGDDDIQSTTFTLSHATEDLTIGEVDWSRIGVRLTSVGEDREGSLKLQVPPVIEIGGQKIEDIDGDGQIDAGVDLGIPGWGVSLYLDQDGDGEADADELVASMTTDADGFYLFTDLTPGDYLIVEENRPGWTATTPMLIELDGVSQGDTFFGQNFLNFDLIDISGEKFVDVDGDGVKDAGEGDIEVGKAFTIELSVWNDADMDGEVDAGETSGAITTISDATTGAWAFNGLGPLGEDEVYLVRELGEAGWVQTFGGPVDPIFGYAVDATSGNDTSGLDFGNFKLPPPDGGDGEGNTPGFWKNHLNIFEQETGRSRTDLYEDVFGVTLLFDGQGSKKKEKYPTDPTLAEALAAKGGGEGALLRASTAALANAASDDVNYEYGETDSLKIGISEVTGIDPLADPLGFIAAFTSIFETIEFMDRDDDGFVDEAEVILAVQDVYGDIGVDDAFDFGDIGDVAMALDAMNNMPSVDTSDFHI